MSSRDDKKDEPKHGGRAMTLRECMEAEESSFPECASPPCPNTDGCIVTGCRAKANTFYVRPDNVKSALLLARSALRRWTDLYAHLQNESGEVVSRKLDYNLPPADHVKALEAIDEALALTPSATGATYDTERAALVAEVGECCQGNDPLCTSGCLVEKALLKRGIAQSATAESKEVLAKADALVSKLHDALFKHHGEGSQVNELIWELHNTLRTPDRRVEPT